MIMDKSSERTCALDVDAQLDRSRPRRWCATAMREARPPRRRRSARLPRRLIDSGVVELIERRSPQVGTQRRGEAEARQLGKQLAIAAHPAGPIARKG
jgi:hypothetical protein